MTDSEILRSLGPFSESEVELFKTYRQLRLFKRKDLLIRAGDIGHSIYFLKTGAIVQYTGNGKDEKKYTNLHVAGEWLANYKSFLNQTQSESYMEAFTDCEVVEVSLGAIHKLIEQSSAFLHLNRVLGAMADRIDFFDRDSTPAEKYESLIRHNPRVIQTFPLKAIASYLKITSETLSRVRSKA